MSSDDDDDELAHAIALSLESEDQSDAARMPPLLPPDARRESEVRATSQQQQKSEAKKRQQQSSSLPKQEFAIMPYSLSVVDPEWEVLDPTPNVHELFMQFNGLFFDDKLSRATVSWSPRMTLCAGVCSFDGQACSIRLSVPLLKLRPRSDLVQTLLHEMIHGYLFLYGGSLIDHDRSGHGPNFLMHMEVSQACLLFMGFSCTSS